MGQNAIRCVALRCESRIPPIHAWATPTRVFERIRAPAPPTSTCRRGSPVPEQVLRPRTRREHSPPTDVEPGARMTFRSVRRDLRRAGRGRISPPPRYCQTPLSHRNLGSHSSPRCAHAADSVPQYPFEHVIDTVAGPLRQSIGSAHFISSLEPLAWLAVDPRATW